MRRSEKLLTGDCSIWLFLRYMRMKRDDSYCWGSINLTKKVKKIGTQRGTSEKKGSLYMIKTTGLGGVVSEGGVGDRLVKEGLGIG